MWDEGQGRTMGDNARPCGKKRGERTLAGGP